MDDVVSRTLGPTFSRGWAQTFAPVQVPRRVGWRSSTGGDNREAAVSLGKAAYWRYALDPDLAPIWSRRMIVSRAHGPPTRPSFARNSSMILVL
jgi:hypothetical protein